MVGQIDVYRVCAAAVPDLRRTCTRSTPVAAARRRRRCLSRNRIPFSDTTSAAAAGPGKRRRRFRWPGRRRYRSPTTGATERPTVERRRRLLDRLRTLVRVSSRTSSRPTRKNAQFGVVP